MGDVIRGGFAGREGSLPPEGGNMEARVAKLEASVEHIKSDIIDIKADLKEIRSNFQKLPYWFIGTFLGMGALVTGLIYFVHTSNQQFMSILVNALK